VQNVFRRLGDHCQRLLTYISYDELSMREVCEQMHYQNEQVVRNKKYKCMQELKSLLRAQPALVQLLKEMTDESGRTY
jgi:hypothetical protein